MKVLKMRKAGFEPARLSPPPPQDGVSTSSTTSAYLIFFLQGESIELLNL